MKNIHNAFTTALLMAVLALAASCEKASLSDMTGKDGGEPNLVLRVVTTGQEPMTRADGETAWKGVNQKEGETGYGQAELTLEAGTYQVLVMAHSSDGNPTTTAAEKIQFTNAMGFTDTFYYYGTITVTGQKQTHNITLNRVTALLRFIINDDMPERVTNLKFYYTGGSGALNATTGVGCVDSKQTVIKVVDRTTMTRPYAFDLYTIPKEPTARLNLTVTAYDEAQTAIYERSFKGIEVQVNRITEFSGDFFTTEPTPGGEDPQGGEETTAGNDIFMISANTEWAGVITQTY